MLRSISCSICFVCGLGWGWWSEWEVDGGLLFMTVTVVNCLEQQPLLQEW